MNFLLEPFLRKMADPARPVVIGLSGGADSLALFYAALECKVPLIVAHVHHGQRIESDQEEETLRSLAAEKGVPFHCKRLALGEMGEEAMRNERFSFFREVVKKTGAQAVLLGHHRKDQAETVLKRVLEGAWYRGGMGEAMEVEGLTVWRPLLDVPKEKLVAYLQERKIPWFEDVTNRSDAFLRGKMREKIFPFLSQAFGKGIEPPLSRMAKEVDRVGDYLAEENRPLLEKRVEGELGFFYDWSGEKLHPARWWHLVKTVCPELSYKEVEIMAEALASKKGNVSVSKYFIDRGILFRVEPFIWEVGEGDSCEPTDWRDVVKGKVCVIHREGLTFAKPDPGARYGNKSLREWWTEHKVPALFRPLLPVLVKDGEVVHEFLTGVRKGESNEYFCCYVSVLRLERRIELLASES